MTDGSTTHETLVEFDPGRSVASELTAPTAAVRRPARPHDTTRGSALRPAPAPRDPGRP